MGICATYWLYCTFCDEDAGSSKLTAEDAWVAAADSGWYVKRHANVALCTDCWDGEQLVHVQKPNVFCVLCQTGDHLAVIV